MSESPAFNQLLDTKNPSFQQVLGCVFGIQKHESETYLLLLEHPGSTVAELAERADRDRSNVNRSLSTLMDKGLADRNRRLLDPGGYVYQYTATELPEAKSRLHSALDAWADSVHNCIDTYGIDEVPSSEPT